MPPRDPFERDNLDEDREILDIIPERFDSGVLAGGVTARHIFGDAPKDHQLSTPVIHAEDKPIKVKPQDRGGMDVPNQDKLIYDRMAAKKDEQAPERLLPPPEQAQTPPAPEPRSAPPAGTTPALTASNPPVPALSAPLPPPAVTAPAPTPAPAKPQPTPQPVKPTPTPAPAAAPPAAKAVAAGSWVVQLGAVHSEGEAKSEWSRIKGAHPELSGLSPDIVQVDIPGKGLFWRVRGGPLDEAQARVLCSTLSKQGQGCLVAKK
jgi:cell division protein FtsN